MPIRTSLLAALCGACFSPNGSASEASDAAAPQGAHALDAVLVTATRVEDATGDLAATASVIDSEQIDRQLARDIRDLVRYEPGVYVSNEVSRFGLGGFSIRGLGGNRVAVEIDGIPAPDAFSIGSFSSATRDGIDIDLIKQVEIVRGPGSSLFGSDALAGVIGFVTRDPLDVLGGEDGFYGRAKLGVFSVDDGRSGNAIVAGARGRWSVLLATTQRYAHERENAGENDGSGSQRTVPNPQDSRDRSLLARLVYDIDADQRLRLTADAQRNHTDTDVITARTTTSSGPSQVRTDLLLGEDRQLRDRVALDYHTARGNAWFDEATFLVYRQDSDTVQDTFERRTTIAASGAQAGSERERRFTFEQAVEGFETTLERSLRAGAVEHRLVYGLDRQRTDTAQQRDGLQRNLASGTQSPVIGPDAFPVRDFPISRTTEAGIFVQDRIRWGGERFELLPGLRWDQVRLDPRPDAIFGEDNPGVVPQQAGHDALSPKLAAAWRFAPAWSLHAQWAEGFRAPPYSDVNVGFTNLQFGYTAKPNPDLRPETSRGTELGLRVRGASGYLALTVFRNDYRDFIESFVSLGVDPATGLLVFQSQNLTDVRIEGAELRASLDGGRWSGAFDGWRLDTSLSAARGNNRSARVPLDSIEPARAVVGLGYTSADARWGLDLIATAVQRKRRVDDSAGIAFRPPGHVLLDLLAQWNPTERVEVNAGVFNLLDKRHWQWGDVRGHLASEPALDRYTSPGRNLGLNLILEL